MNRRRFIRNAATGLLVPTLLSSVLQASGPIPFSFWKRGGGVTYDPDVLDWVTRVIANGGSVSQGTKDIAQAYSTAITSIRSGIFRRNFFGGTGFLAAQVPFIKDLGGTLDLPKIGSSGTAGSGSDFTYNETGSSGGLDPLTSQAWLATGLFVNSIDVNNRGFSVYVRTTAAESAVVLGAANNSGGAGFYSYITAGDGNFYYNICQLEIGPVTDATGKGFYTVSRTASNLVTAYRNAVSINTNAAPGATSTTAEVAIFCLLVDTGLAQQFSTKTLGGYVIHRGFDASETAILNTAEAALQTAFMRNV